MKDIVCFDPLLFKSPEGVISKGTTVKFRVKTERDIKPDKVYFMLRADSEDAYQEFEMKEGKAEFYIDHYFEKRGHYWYSFKVITGSDTKYLNKTYYNFSALEETKGEDFFQLVTEFDYKCTNSMQGGIIYQIFVDRFAKVGEVKCREPLVLRDDWGGGIHKNTTDPIKINQEVFGGNLRGVISKLDYLKNLGVTTIYFNPICMANSNHKYDTADYSIVDPMFGDHDDFVNLLAEAKVRGIKIVIDGVYNHTGSDSIYFNKYNRFKSIGAYNSQKSQFYNWYNFTEYPDKYACWWGIDTLPALREDCKEFEDYIAGNGGLIEHLMELGVDGVRLDVVDEIKDNFVKKISNKVAEYGENRIVMGEVWEDASIKISYSARREYFSNNELNSVMNYPIKESILNFVRNKEPNDLVSTIRMIQNNYPKAVQDNLMNFLGTHDTGRMFSELTNLAGGDKEIAKKLFKICFVLTFTMIGVPSIFYGDEYGMENNDGSSRGCFDWQNYKNDIYYWVEALTKIRKHKVFVSGKLNILYAKNGKFVFERVCEDERVIVMVNLRPSPINVKLNGIFRSFFTGRIKPNFTLKENEFEILFEEKPQNNKII